MYILFFFFLHKDQNFSIALNDLKNNTSVKAITTLNGIEAHFSVRLQQVGESEGPDGKNKKQIHTCVFANKRARSIIKTAQQLGYLYIMPQHSTCIPKMQNLLRHQ